jgi:hypothetical protein
MLSSCEHENEAFGSIKGEECQPLSASEEGLLFHRISQTYNTHRCHNNNTDKTGAKYPNKGYDKGLEYDTISLSTKGMPGKNRYMYDRGKGTRTAQ